MAGTLQNKTSINFMKYLFFLGAFLFALPTYSQKFGYVDADFVLSKMESYQKAQQNIDEAAKKWEEDVQKKFAQVDKLRKAFQAEEVLLTDDMKEERKKEIDKADMEARDYQRKIFGHKGQLFTRQAELIKPAQEALHKALQTLARKEKLQVILNNSEALSILYIEERHDYTEQVLELLGLGEKKGNPENKGTDSETPNNKPPDKGGKKN
jgi:outer membrane protein